MAGLNFQTLTIINSNLDPDSGKNVKLFETKGDSLFIKRDFLFHKNNTDKGSVSIIRKRNGYKETYCKASIDFGNAALLAAIKPTSGKSYCRLDVYVGIEGAEPFIYSTPWVQKGMPFWIEFTVKSTDTAAIIVKNVADTIRKNHIFLCDKDLINVSISGTKLVLEGATEYLRFKKVEISIFEADEEYSELVVELGDTTVVLEERGKNSFGTYSLIVKDLRLPTAANYQWSHIRQVETPIIGAVYNQYIIEYKAPASNEGLSAVGQKLESHTTHVFWVKNDSALITEWETALAIIGTIIDADKVANPASTVNELGE